MKLNPIHYIIISALSCIPLVGIGMYLDFVVFNNTPFFNIGKMLGVIAVIQLAVVGVIPLILENKSDNVSQRSLT